ncbi:hypothetical protein [Streptomyces sp. 049-1]|uniref:hypothetical protein n=1 Tax=Streptomyces sp. 049-1 TaxID=2789264 RepID=UPI0039813578
MGSPWLPQPSSFGGPADDAQREDPDSTLHLYRAAVRLRRAAGADGRPFWNERADPRLLDFTSGTLRCLVNASTDDVPLDAPGTPVLSSSPLPTSLRVLPPGTVIWHTGP